MHDILAIINELSNLNPPEKSFDNRLILRALAVIGNPEQNYKVIHLAGTNGKGSTAAFIEHGLVAAGYKVGKYSSPYIHCINECICVNQRMISNTELAAIYLEHKDILDQHEIYLSSFEMLTLLMFVYCARQHIDYLVLETGLGGRDDATNVVDSVVSVITNISLEHTQFLGGDLLSIAKHKAGIIKTGYTVVGDNIPELIQAVTTQTANYTSIRDKYQLIAVELNNEHFITELTFIDNVSSQTRNVVLGLFGYFQVYNFLCAYEVLQHIGVKWGVIETAVRHVTWHGRLERLNTNPLTIADASHNVDGVRNLAQSLASWFPREGSVIICSILSDKDIPTMLDYYSRISNNIIFCAIPDQLRTSNAKDLTKLAQGKFKTIQAFDSPHSAMQQAQSIAPQAILITGSCYLLKYFCEE
jgi:dihydrofolate synthase/folylpolyglutamate synthase